MRPVVRVTSADESGALDAAAIGAGVPSRTLMQRAGAAAAGEIARRYPQALRGGISIFAGPGNNGGDAWVVARALAAAGVRVRVTAVGEPRTADATAERELARGVVEEAAVDRALAPVVVDGLLGTGSRGAPREQIAGAIARINEARANGATIVSLDVPSGLDATTGMFDLAVHAHLTLTFGTLKRGLAVSRELAGRIAVLDIGLETPLDAPPGVRREARGEMPIPMLVTAGWVRRAVPAIAADAHKGTRKRLAIIGGAVGMAGAPMLAARAAMRSGAGMVRLAVEAPNVAVVQGAVPQALAGAWPRTDAELRGAILDWAHALLIGPGLGDSGASRELVERLLGAWRGPVVLDADALNVFKGDAPALGALLNAREIGRAALLTPHVNELARLAGVEPSCVLERRFDIGAELARTTGATVLLKGVPTVIGAPDGERLVSAAGTPALAAAGSGDLLAGIAATLLAQTGDPLTAGACAAWAHGRAAEIAGDGSVVRGVTLDDIELAISRVWTAPDESPSYPVLAELPPVGGR